MCSKAQAISLRSGISPTNAFSCMFVKQPAASFNLQKRKPTLFMSGAEIGPTSLYLADNVLEGDMKVTAGNWRGTRSIATRQ